MGTAPAIGPSRRCLVIIPAHEEAADIGAVVRSVRRQTGFPVLVVDDASRDATVPEARRAGAMVLPFAVQLGAWGAIQAGLRYALKHGFDFAITMDGDGQHRAESIPELLRPVVAGEAGVAIGACTGRGSLLRRIAWVWMKRVSGLRLEDITSGFRVYDRGAIEVLASREATLLEYQDVGVLALLHARGIRLADVDVTMRPRSSGISRIYHSWFAVLYYMSYTLLLGLTKRTAGRRAPY